MFPPCEGLFSPHVVRSFCRVQGLGELFELVRALGDRLGSDWCADVAGGFNCGCAWSGRIFLSALALGYSSSSKNTLTLGWRVVARRPWAFEIWCVVVGRPRPSGRGEGDHRPLWVRCSPGGLWEPRQRCLLSSFGSLRPNHRRAVRVQ